MTNQTGILKHATPPELAEPTEPLPVLPAKRPFDALTMDVKARRVTNSSFELFNYQSKCARPFENLRCWARLDLCVSQPQLTMKTGPPMSHVKWRRTIDANSNQIIFEGVFNPDNEDEEKHNFDGPMNTITELWYSKPSRKTQAFRAFDDALEEIEPGWDGSEDTPLPSSKKYYKVYATKLAKTVDDHFSRPSDTETEVEDYKTGAPSLTRQEKKAIEKELHYRDILSQSEEYIQEFIKSAQKEEASFMEWKSLKPVPPAEAQEILRDPQKRKRDHKPRLLPRQEQRSASA